VNEVFSFSSFFFAKMNSEFFSGDMNEADLMNYFQDGTGEIGACSGMLFVGEICC
jgi:hypothetical protein